MLYINEKHKRKNIPSHFSVTQLLPASNSLYGIWRVELTTSQQWITTTAPWLQPTPPPKTTELVKTISKQKQAKQTGLMLKIKVG